MNNEVIATNQVSHPSWNKDCPPSALQSMGDRLLDWFSVIMSDAKRRRTKNKGKGSSLSIYSIKYFVTYFKIFCSSKIHQWMQVGSSLDVPTSGFGFRWKVVITRTL